MDVAGARAIKQNFPAAILIFIAPPDMSALECRIRARADKHMSEDELQDRLHCAVQEMESRNKYDHVVVNKKLSDAVEAVRRILDQAETK